MDNTGLPSYSYLVSGLLRGFDGIVGGAVAESHGGE